MIWSLMASRNTSASGIKTARMASTSAAEKPHGARVDHEVASPSRNAGEARAAEADDQGEIIGVPFSLSCLSSGNGAIATSSSRRKRRASSCSVSMT